MVLTPEIIRICRITLGWTQQKLARSSKVSCTLLGAIEREERGLQPYIETRIRQALPLTDDKITEIVQMSKSISGK